MNVIKRDGSEQIFDSSKIKIAITKANNSVSEVARIKESTINTIVSSISAKCNALNRAVGIEEIQDFVEDELIDHRAKAVAKAYVVYRYEHKLIRDKYSDLMKKVSDKIFAKNVKNDNANMDENSFSGRMGQASDVLLREFALNCIMSPLAKESHENNRIYTHDLNTYAVGMHNCLSIPYDHLLKNGFDTRSVDIRGAHSLNTACQVIAVIAQLQSLQQFGGVSATHVDWSLVPYVRISFFKHFKDGLKFIYKWSSDEIKFFLESNDLTEESSITNKSYTLEEYVYSYAFTMIEKECHQGIEALYHNLNSLQSRAGGQLPFTSINYGTCTLPEGRMIIKEILEIAIDGLGRSHRTSVFPCLIFQCKRGVNRKPGDPNYDLFRLALKSTALRLYPNYCNGDWSVQQKCVKLDRELKNRVLASLTEDEVLKLTENLKKHPEELWKVGLKFEDNKLVVNMEETPLEMNGTMGKFTCSPCKIWLTLLKGCA